MNTNSKDTNKKGLNVLLTFVGYADLRALENGESSGSSILTILNERAFDKIYLFHNSTEFLQIASKVLMYCRDKYPKIEVNYTDIDVKSPIDHNLVYPAMFSALEEIKVAESGANFTISITSGTPTMHACWLLLKQSGVIDAELIQTSKKNGIEKVLFHLDDFPKLNAPDEIKVKMTKLSRENRQLKEEIFLESDDIIGKSAKMIEVKKQIRQFSQYLEPVYIHGESGTGKELVANAIHNRSNRKDNLIITVNCGAVPTALFESQFFGHKKGAFTGAISDSLGYFLKANGGTIFLDEIGDLALDNQVKLLRVLENQTIQPVGADIEEKVDVRIISASNKNLKELVNEGKFRDDLYWRICVVKMTLPPLNERENDIILIANHILDGLNKKYKSVKRVSEMFTVRLLKHSYSGNIRELKNLMNRAYIATAGEEIMEREFLPDSVIKRDEKIYIPAEGFDLDNDIIPQYHTKALAMCDGNATAAAKLLKIEPATFRKRLHKFKATKSNYGNDKK